MVVPSPVLGAIKREGRVKGEASAFAPVLESMSLVTYTKVSLLFSLFDAKAIRLSRVIRSDTN
jgi:hypothetical protein